MRTLSGRRLIAIVVFLIWAAFLILGLAGGTTGIAGVPHAVTATSGLIALVSLIFFLPAGALYGLLLARRTGTKNPASSLAIRQRWPYALAGGFATLVGCLLVLSPSPQTTYLLRAFGIGAFVWGILGIAIAILAFRTKARFAVTIRPNKARHLPPKT